MHILIIGGSVFLGRHLVSAALAANHQVTTLNRGTHNLPEQANVEKLIADRENDLAILSDRSFDAVIDTCGYRPEVVCRSVNSGVEPWTELPLWIPDSDSDFAGFLQVDEQDICFRSGATSTGNHQSNYDCGSANRGWLLSIQSSTSCSNAMTLRCSS